MAAELTTLVGEQKHIVREGTTTLVAQCTGESSACYNALNSAVCTSQVNHNIIVIPNRKKCRLYKYYSFTLPRVHVLAPYMYGILIKHIYIHVHMYEAIMYNNIPCAD